jgi:hypothetical protein
VRAGQLGRASGRRPLRAAPRRSEFHPDGAELRSGAAAVVPTSLPGDAERPLEFPLDDATVVAHADLPGRSRSRDGGLPGLRPALSSQMTQATTSKEQL